MKKLITIVCILISQFIYAQDVVVLKNDVELEGKIVKMEDSILIFNYKKDGEYVNYEIKKSSIKTFKQARFNNFKYNDNVLVSLITNQSLSGKLIENNEKDIKLFVENNMSLDTMLIEKAKIRSMKLTDFKNAVDLGFLRGGALVGVEFEFPLGKKATILMGAGYRGFTVGFNGFFNDKFEGAGLKFAYVNQGFGDSYAGSLFTSSLFYKMRGGISIDLGIGNVMGRGNFNYGGNDFILVYGIGARF